MLNEAEYRILRARIDAMGAWVDSNRGRNGWASYHPSEVPENLRPEPTNEERSAVECYEFVHNPPERYFAYVNEESASLTTWTGDKIGAVSFGREFRDNFGGRRVPIRVRAINGRNYSGTYYKSAGSYCRIRVVA